MGGIISLASEKIGATICNVSDIRAVSKIMLLTAIDCLIIFNYINFLQ